MFNLKKKSLKYIIGASFLLVFVCSLIPSVRKPLLDIFRNPLLLARLAGREINGIIFFHRNLVENERLGKQVDLLNQKINSLQETSIENARLKSLLNLKQQAPFKVIPARVIGRSPNNWSSVIIIDKGSYHGIKAGMAVIAYTGLAGRVMECAYFISKVMLINDPDFSVSAIDQRSRQEGLVSGTLGNLLVMKYLPKEADIKPEDIIVTSGLSTRFPKGLGIGIVIDIADELSGLGRYCLIRPSVNLSGIEEVLVIAQ